MNTTQARIFVVGDPADGADFTTEEIEKLVLRIALWFRDPLCDRTYEDPLAEARKRVRECLLAITEDGSPWRTAPKEFAGRIKAKCAFDMEKDAGIPSRRVKNPLAVAKQQQKQAEAGADGALNDVGDLLGFDEEAFRAEMQQEIIDKFPELDNPASLPNVRSLVMYYAQRELIDRQLTIGVSDSKRLTLLESLRKIEDMTDVTMKRLGIHPDQIRKKISDKGNSSVADLVSQISDDPDFRAREKTWALQLALQLWWMSQHLDGAGAGPQMHEFEIWHMTRSRPVQFTCRHGETYTVIEGFEPHQLRDYLLANGVLVEEPVIPGIIDRAQLKGLVDAPLPGGDHAGTQEADDGDRGGSGVAEGASGGPDGLPGTGDADLHDGPGSGQHDVRP